MSRVKELRSNHLNICRTQLLMSFWIRTIRRFTRKTKRNTKLLHWMWRGTDNFRERQPLTLWIRWTGIRKLILRLKLHNKRWSNINLNNLMWETKTTKMQSLLQKQLLSVNQHSWKKLFKTLRTQLFHYLEAKTETLCISAMGWSQKLERLKWDLMSIMQFKRTLILIQKRNTGQRKSL